LRSDGTIDLPYQLREVAMAPISEIMTFYLPIFFTFRALSSQSPEKVTKILKFWCVLSISYILQYVYSLVLAEYLQSDLGT
jgi:putative flippase GtrA